MRGQAWLLRRQVTAGYAPSTPSFTNGAPRPLPSDHLLGVSWADMKVPDAPRSMPFESSLYPLRPRKYHLLGFSCADMKVPDAPRSMLPIVVSWLRALYIFSRPAPPAGSVLNVLSAPSAPCGIAKTARQQQAGLCASIESTGCRCACCYPSRSFCSQGCS